jgi:hypothetical protein
MVPLFTLVLINAQIPNIHMLLHILMKYGDYDEQGDISYNIANLEGSIMFLMQMDIPFLENVEEKVAQLPMFQSIAAACSKAKKHRPNGSDDHGADLLGSSPPGTYSGFGASGGNAAKDGDEDQLAMEELGIANKISFSFVIVMYLLLLLFFFVGEWLRDQRTMEDTIAILQNDGWML